jgi:hypothetical protein
MFKIIVNQIKWKSPRERLQWKSFLPCLFGQKDWNVKRDPAPDAKKKNCLYCGGTPKNKK